MKLCLGSTPVKSLNIRKLDVDTNDATIVASDMQSGSIAYAKGQKVTGTGSNGFIIDEIPSYSFRRLQDHLCELQRQYEIAEAYLKGTYANKSTLQKGALVHSMSILLLPSRFVQYTPKTPPFSSCDVKNSLSPDTLKM